MDQPLDLATMAPLCEAYYETLVAALSRRFPHEDLALIADAVEDALIGYFKWPQRHNPVRSSLITYLLMSARADLLNRRRREARHTRRRADVELDSLDGKGRETPLDLLARDEDTESLRMRFDAVHRNADPRDQAVLDLMLAGEKRTEVFAETIGVGQLSQDEKEREVKRVKDRLKKRLYRGGIEHGAA